MLRQAREGRIDVGAACLLAFRGLTHPSPEEAAGASLIACALNDLHVLAADKRLKE